MRRITALSIAALMFLAAAFTPALAEDLPPPPPPPGSSGSPYPITYPPPGWLVTGIWVVSTDPCINAFIGELENPVMWNMLHASVDPTAYFLSLAQANGC